MKIAVVTSPFCPLPPDAIGAVERLWFDLTLCFSRRGHEVQLIGKKDKTILPDGVNLRRDYVSGFRRTGSVYGDIVLDFFYSLRALRRIRPCDVLVANTFWCPVLAPIFFRRKYKKLVYNVARFPKRHLRLYRGVDLFACTSKAVANALVCIIPRFASRICVVSNPVEIAGGDSSGGNKRKWLVGYHGRVHKEKGLDILARAIADLADEFPQIRIKVIGAWDVGSGGSGESYKSCLDCLSGGRIDWIGPEPDRKRLATELMECSVYCYPSVAEKGETFGVSPLEAMALGLPTIVSGLECFEDFLKDGENGLVFNHRAENPAGELTAKLKMALGCETLGSRLGLAAAETAKGFSTELISGKWIVAFEELMK